MLKICRSCGRHVREEKCPFCGGNAFEPKPNLRPILGEKLIRAALVLGSALAISSCGKKGDEKVPSQNTIEPKPDAQETPSTQTGTPTPSPAVTQSSWVSTNEDQPSEDPNIFEPRPPIPDRPRPDDIVHYGGPPMRNEDPFSPASAYGGPDFWERKSGEQ